MHSPQHQNLAGPSHTQSPAHDEHSASLEEEQEYLADLYDWIGQNAADQGNEANRLTGTDLSLRKFPSWDKFLTVPQAKSNRADGVRGRLVRTVKRGPIHVQIEATFGNYLRWVPQKDLDDFWNLRPEKIHDSSPMRRVSKRLPGEAEYGNTKVWIYMVDHLAKDQLNDLPQDNALYQRNFLTFWSLPQTVKHGQSRDLVSLGAGYFEPKDLEQVDRYHMSSLPAFEHVGHV